MPTATTTQFQELYLAYLGRFADYPAMTYWQAKGITRESLAEELYLSSEYQNIYNKKSIAFQVNHLYKNLFARNANIDELLDWTNKIEEGKVALATLAINLINRAQNNSNIDDKTTLDHRASYAAALSADIQGSSCFAMTNLDLTWTNNRLFIKGRQLLRDFDHTNSYFTRPPCLIECQPVFFNWCDLDILMIIEEIDILIGIKDYDGNLHGY